MWSSKEFYAQYPTHSIEREVAVVREVLNYNVPSWMFEHMPVQCADITVEVTPDYLSIGTDDDYVRTPLTPYAAQYLADQLGYKLPNPTLVNEIYKQADQWLTPITTNWYTTEGAMQLGSNYVLHSQLIDEKIKAPGSLLAGHKKDVVSTPLLKDLKHSVAIYGWHLGPGEPIQHLYLGHDWTYCDYSHGIRFVKTDSHLAGKCCLLDPPSEFLKLVGK